MELVVLNMIVFCCLIFIHLTHGFNFDELNIQFGKTLKGGVKIEKFYGKSVKQCIDECDARAKCRYIEYIRRAQVCILNDNVTSETTAEFTRAVGVDYMDKRSWLQDHGQCDSGTNTCAGGKVCDSEQDTCVAKECGIPVAPSNGYILGNMVKENSRIVVRCHEGYMLPNVGSWHTTSTCTGGTWTPSYPAECVIVTCKAVAVSYNTTGVVSGSYRSIETGTDKLVDIFCDFQSGHGYTYFSKASLHHVSDLSIHFTRTDHVMIRHLKDDGVQKEANITLLPKFRNKYNISVLLSNYDGFKKPEQHSHVPYIYLGLVPVSDGPTKGTIQGYSSDGTDYEFKNTDGNSNNYFAIFANHESLTQVIDGYCCSGNIARGWISSSHDIGTDKKLLPELYFYQFEMHMGGGGAFMTDYNDDDGITGAAFGLRFDI